MTKLNPRYKDGYVSWASFMDDETIKQINNLVAHPFVQIPVAVMPDCHAGAGATIGSVFKTFNNTIIPMAVGVDIGCGMRAAELDTEFCLKIEKFDTEERRRKFFDEVSSVVPVGFNGFNAENSVHKYYLEQNQKALNRLIDRLANSKDFNFKSKEEERWFRETAIRQLGTLGGGNHFLSLMSTKDESKWFLVVHSGSRRIGHFCATRFYEEAAQKMASQFGDDWGSYLRDRNLAYLQGEDANRYFRVQQWLLEYAELNRFLIVDRIQDLLGVACTYHIDTTHNFVRRAGNNRFLTRKGACSAKKDEWVIIPGSMGSETYIVKGLGNPDSFNSCSHGAGRRMSRSQAKKTFTIEDVVSQTEGVVCKKDESILDELPQAYKDIKTVMEDQKDLVEIIYELHDRVCIKG